MESGRTCTEVRSGCVNTQAHTSPTRQVLPPHAVVKHAALTGGVSFDSATTD
jgi:hypothetical protein